MVDKIAIQVNLDQCTRCGLCAEVCPSGIIRVNENGPELTWPKACIKCGHCVAVCPHAALDHTRNSLASQVEVSQYPRLDAETAERFLRTRRSVRAYKPESVPPETLMRLLNVARFAPSGGNSQGISYLVLSDRAVLKKITEQVVEWLEEQIRQEVSWVKSYAGMAKIYRETGYDIALRNAPHLVLALASAQSPIGRDNGRYALAYAELYAPSLGLGSCWAGFFEMAAFSGYKPLLEILDIPEGKTLAGAIMLGIPKYWYYRLVERNPLDVTLR
jgi:nitroreductase/NAD-dependent dihydropyrimidine dehydrogenase PreA subunit